MILYALPQSPYCAKVRIVLGHKQIKFDECEPMGGSYQTTEYQQLVAAGSVPAIQIDDWVLHDSQAIIEYLEEQYPGPSVWSKAPQVRAQQRALVHYHDCKFEPAVRALVPYIKQPDTAERVQNIALAHDRLFDRLFRLNKMVTTGPWLSGAELSAADFSFPATIYMGLDLLTHLDRELALPDQIAQWLDVVMKKPLIESEVSRLRGAVAQWLGSDETLN